MMKQLPPVAEIHAEYNLGVSAAEIGLRLGVSGDTILARFRKAGLPTRTKKEASQHPRKKALVAAKATGRITWNVGLSAADDDRVQAYSAKLSGRRLSDATRRLISERRSKHKWFRECQKCGRHKGFNRSSMCVLCAAKFRVEHYPNGMKGRKLSASHKEALGIANGRQRAMTKPERKAMMVMEHVFGPYNPYTYSGHGDSRYWVRIPGKDRVRNPDFVAPEMKKVVEVFGRHWHPPSDEQKAIEDYAAAGWECLVIWEDETFWRDMILYFTYPDEEANELHDFMRTPL